MPLAVSPGATQQRRARLRAMAQPVARDYAAGCGVPRVCCCGRVAVTGAQTLLVAHLLFALAFCMVGGGHWHWGKHSYRGPL